MTSSSRSRPPDPAPASRRIPAPVTFFRRLLLPFVALLLAASLGACGEEERADSPERGAQAPEDRAAIDSVYHRFSVAYTLLDPDSVAELYTEDALYLPAAGDVIRGRPAIRTNFANFFGSVRESGRQVRISFVTLDRRTGSDLAYDVGYYTLESGPPGATPAVSRGKFATVWRRGLDGTWRIHVDAFSPAPPEPGPEGADTAS